MQVKDKLKKLYRLHNRYLMLKERKEIIDKLIKRNKRNDVIKIKKLEVGDEALNLQNLINDDTFLKFPKKKSILKTNRLDSTTLSKSLSNLEDSAKERVKIPFYFYRLKSLSVSLFKSVTYDGRHRLTLLSKSPSTPFLFEDFEIIKKLI